MESQSRVTIKTEETKTQKAYRMDPKTIFLCYCLPDEVLPMPRRSNQRIA